MKKYQPCRVDLKGKNFGAITVVKEGPRVRLVYGASRRVFWLRRWFVACACGKTKLILQASLLSGKTRSCGCHIGTGTWKHGLCRKNERTPEYALWQAAKRRAKVKNIVFSLKTSDIIIPALCPVFGFPLKAHKGEGPGAKDDSPTLDRIDNQKGYTKSNTWVISGKANKAKSNLSFKELALLYKALMKKVKQ